MKQLINFLLVVLGVLFKAFVMWKIYIWYLVPIGFPFLSVSGLYGVFIFYLLIISRDRLWSMKKDYIENGHKIPEKNIRTDILFNLLGISLFAIFLGIGYFIK